MNQNDPAGNPVATAPGFLTTPALPINIATLSGLTIADTSDYTCLLDPIGMVPYNHNTFYYEDGNVEVLCDDTLFRVHTSILRFTRSPTLRQMFAQTSLATAGSPYGCPRILSSDMDTDFAILLKMMYHSGYVICPRYANELLHFHRFPEQNITPDFTTFSSLLRFTAKYEMPTIRSQILETVRPRLMSSFWGSACHLNPLPQRFRTPPLHLAY